MNLEIQGIINWPSILGDTVQNPNIFGQFFFSLCSLWLRHAHQVHVVVDGHCSSLWLPRKLFDKQIMYWNYKVYFADHILLLCYLEKQYKIPLTGLNRSHFCVCPKPGPRFPTSYVVAFFCFHDMRWEVIVCFVDIGGHHCINLFFINRIQLPVYICYYISTFYDFASMI